MGIQYIGYELLTDTAINETKELLITEGENYMELIDAIKGRRSIRRFLKKEIPEHLIRELIEAARWAPSARNEQQWRFSVLTGNSKESLIQSFRESLTELSKQMGIKQMGSSFWTSTVMDSAPVLIIVWNAGKHGWPVEPHGVAAAVQNLLLRAHELGLGGLWIGDVWYTPTLFVERLKKDWEFFGAIAIGWPDESPDSRPRMEIDEICEFLN
ncbi:MAG: nitroreductase family protein [Candidatus Thorarchaeota archaeon]